MAASVLGAGIVQVKALTVHGDHRVDCPAPPSRRPPGRTLRPTSSSAPPSCARPLSSPEKKVALVAASPTSCHSVVITVDGLAYGWGRNETGQLGLGHASPSVIQSTRNEGMLTSQTARHQVISLIRY